MDQYVHYESEVICPVSIDFTGQRAVQTLSETDAPAKFDLVGDGTPVTSGWLAPSAGFVAFDQDGDGQITSVHELFGGEVGEGYTKLALFDTNADGVVDAQDSGYALLSVWRDFNVNKVVDQGEMRTLAEAGVVSLDLNHVDFWTFDVQGNATYERSSATFSDGSSAFMAGVYFGYTPATVFLPGGKK